mmetsp:Transcript_23879/g.35036  ORF Transcript_23879/g.35036 Transcript_23879/m.35036 type:complete len:200 (+) Transcript_23879:32-631(+)
MALHFVSTSVLSSSDGIGYEKEEKKETEDTRAARIAAERAASKPLFEQLAEQQEKKQAEYDANTKLIFAPPKALDEEDVEYFQHMEQLRKQQMTKQKEEEEKELAVFRSSKHAATSSISLSKMIKPSAAPASAPKIVVKHKKRKGPSTESNDAPKPKEKTVRVEAKEADQKPEEKKPAGNNSGGGVMSLLSGYDSSDSS